MKNITLSIGGKLLKESREYAKRRNLSLNALVRRLLEQTVTNKSNEWIEELFALMDSIHACSDGGPLPCLRSFSIQIY